MILRIVALSFLATFCYCYFFCLWCVVSFKCIVYLSYKVWSLLYLFSASQLNVACCMMSLPILGTTFCILWLLSVLAAAMTCTMILAVSTTAGAIACIIVSCSVAILDFLFYLLRNWFCETALIESAYFELLMWSVSVCSVQMFTPNTM